MLILDRLLIAPVWNRNVAKCVWTLSSIELLIAPVWNRNCQGSGHKNVRVFLLIAPVWNRNSGIGGLVITSRFSSNRTSLESKQKLVGLYLDGNNIF